MINSTPCIQYYKPGCLPLSMEYEYPIEYLYEVAAVNYYRHILEKDFYYDCFLNNGIAIFVDKDSYARFVEHYCLDQKLIELEYEKLVVNMVLK